MQINGSATNMPYKAPAEVDGQDRSQSRLQTQEQQTTTPASTSRDTVNISPEAQALNSQVRSSDAAALVPEPARVDPGQAVQNVDQNQQNSPAPPVAPEQAPLGTTAEPTETANNPRQQPQSQTTAANPPAQTTETSPQRSSLQEATILTPNVAPQNEPTPQKPAPEGPLAAVGGLSAGKGTIDLNV